MYLINFVSVETLSTGQMIFSERVGKLLLTTSQTYHGENKLHFE